MLNDWSLDAFTGGLSHLHPHDPAFVSVGVSAWQLKEKMNMHHAHHLPSYLLPFSIPIYPPCMHARHTDFLPPYPSLRADIITMHTASFLFFVFHHFPHHHIHALSLHSSFTYLISSPKYMQLMHTSPYHSSQTFSSNLSHHLP